MPEMFKELHMEMTMGGVVRTEEQDGIMVIHFQSEKIHEDTAIHQFLEELGEYIDSTPESRILINMENLDYLSSAGLGNLVGLLKKSRKVGGLFRLCCLKETIQELFEVMRLNKIFEIFEGQEEAIASFSKD